MYKLLQYLRYILVAKSRHGVHSPFVYAFIEEVLRNTPQNHIRKKLVTYFEDRRIIWLTSNTETLPETAPEDIIIIEGIHQSAQANSNWQNLHSNKNVRLSMDVYHYGILCFSTDFKEKQHFSIRF